MNEKKISRRKAIKKISKGVFVAGAITGMPHILNAQKATLELRWLGWEHYNVKSIVEGFEKKYKVKVSSSFFDGNSEAYNKLKTGGTRDFDLVMGDGFWPRLYAKQGLTQSVDYSKIPNMKYVFKDFIAPNYKLLQDEQQKNNIAAPNCWGGYGMTINADKISGKDSDSLGVLFDSKYKKKISVSARFEENIALAGLYAAYTMGTINSPRPDGKSFNPYVLTDREMTEAKKLLIKQKKLLLTRWKDEDTLERLLRSQAVWVAPEWSGIYRRIHFDRLDRKSSLNMKHVLNPKEGGLGWVDTWAITSGVKNTEVLEIAHKWIDWRLSKENMEIIAKDVGWAPTVDIRDRLSDRYIETLFLNQTSSINKLYQFDAPSSPEKWERLWSEVESS